MGDLGQACKAGYRKCVEGTARATRRRRLGSLPAGIAMGCCDIGEAYVDYPDGDRGLALVTWGRNLRPGEALWHLENTAFTPVWVGADDGATELILCPCFSDNKVYRWLRAGLRLVDNSPKWENVPLDGEE
jgi:hypothetical protein